MNRWEHFQHDADIGVRGIADTKAMAFAEAARALTAVVTELGSVKTIDCFDVSITSVDDEMLLVDWLNRLIYEMAVRKMLFSEFEVVIREYNLQAKVCGEPLEVTRHQPAVEVKGATFTELHVGVDEAGNWCAQCIVDV